MVFNKVFFIFMGFIPMLLLGQDFPVEIPDYSYVKKEHNRLQYFGDSSKFKPVFEKMDSVLSYGKGKLNIVHFGGSHIQADILTSQIREHLQEFVKVDHPSRGLVFPFKAAKTNNPGSYNISYTGQWDGCRNSVLRHQCDFGMSGITATAYDTLSSINVSLVNKYHPTYYFKSVKVFHEFGENYFELKVDENVSYDYKVEDHYEGFTEYFFSTYQTEFEIKLNKADSLQSKFVLYGFLFENDEPDIVYHAIGVNGASVPSYLRCEKLQDQLKHLKPDVIVFSIGINDAYESDFTRRSYEKNYNELIEKIQSTCPNVAIIFTTNNDSYKLSRRRRYLNRKGLLVQESMQAMSKKHGAAYWDMFEIMGGLNSSPTWVANGKMKRDKIHFTAEGYRLMGDLFFNALMEKYGDYISQNRN
jgi:lysophospholipase L1-like esterase